MSKSLANDVTPIAAVWLLDSLTVSDEQLQPHLAWLTAGELERYRRFLRPQRQRQFLLGRCLLRYRLAAILNVAPATIKLTERPGLAPLLHASDLPPYFSLSHSGAWIACALSEHTPLGLDIEVKDAARDVLALSEQALDAADVAMIQALQGEARLEAFYRCWSRKEALYKLSNAESAVMPVTDAAATCVTFAHPDISIVLCSALPLAQTPQLHYFAWPGTS